MITPAINKKTLRLAGFLAASFTVILVSCDKTNPFEPEGLLDQAGQWSPVVLPQEVRGEWFWGQLWDLTVTDSTLQDSVKTTSIIEVERQNEVYRIIHRFSDKALMATYIYPVSGGIRVARSDGAAQSAENARLLPVLEWYSVTASPAWAEAGYPECMQGEWGGAFDVVFHGSKLLLDGDWWNVSTVQYNGRVSRLVLAKDRQLKSLYFSGGGHSLNVLLKDGTEHGFAGNWSPSADEWQAIHRLWPLRDYWPLSPGASWLYSYEYKRHYGNNSTGYSSVSINTVKGQLELTVLRADWTEGSSSFELQSRFMIEEDYFRQGYTLLEESHDTSWVATDFEKTYTYTLVEDRDTLWYALGDSLLTCIPMKISATSHFNPVMFNYEGKHKYFSLQLFCPYARRATIEAGKGFTELLFEGDNWFGISTRYDGYSFDLLEYVPGSQ